MSNVEKIDTYRLDSHELTCGRARAGATCSNAWSAMGETSDFFCGADPNDVKYYIYDIHFGSDEQELNDDSEEEENDSSTSDNSILADQLRNLGLIK